VEKQLLSRDHGNASIFTLAILLLALPAVILPISLMAASDARSRAVTVADSIALVGCDNGEKVNIYPEIEIVECVDDGISVSVRTRVPLVLPAFLRIRWFIYAQAQGVHAL
jgi:hypothetical protein